MQPFTALALATAAPVGKLLSMRPLWASTSVLVSTATASAAGRRPATTFHPRHHPAFADRASSRPLFQFINKRQQLLSVLSPSMLHNDNDASLRNNRQATSIMMMGRMITTSTSGNNGNDDKNKDKKSSDDKHEKKDKKAHHQHDDDKKAKDENKSSSSSSNNNNAPVASPIKMGEPLQTPAGLLFRYDSILHNSDRNGAAGSNGEMLMANGVLMTDGNNNTIGMNELDNLLPKAGDNLTEVVRPPESDFFFIPQVKLHDGDGSERKRVLVLCTGGTLTMAPNPDKGGALSPVPGALTDFMKSMLELTNDKMPDVVVHEYTPLLDSSDMGPPDWALLANDIKANYLHFDGFVILMGTDTMAYTATALSFMLENLGKPVVFTGSQVPIAEPHSDARQNLIMALIFASRDVPICEVTLFFHDRVLRACRSQKVNTGALHAFDSPNMPPLAKVGISIQENDHLILPQARGALRVHTQMDTRLLALRLVPGFDDQILRHTIRAGAESGSLRALVLQLYGTGNAPMVKDDLIECLEEAKQLGILVIASTQCHRGSVMMGHYATGQALQRVGVVSSNDMTLEAISCKVAYLMGRGDLTVDEIGNLMCVSMRGEVTHTDALPPPPFTSAYQRASRKGRYFY